MLCTSTLNTFFHPCSFILHSICRFINKVYTNLVGRAASKHVHSFKLSAAHCHECVTFFFFFSSKAAAMPTTTHRQRSTESRAHFSHFIVKSTEEESKRSLDLIPSLRTSLIRHNF